MEPNALLLAHLKKLFDFKDQNFVSVEGPKEPGKQPDFRVIFSGDEAELEAGKFASFLYDEGLESGTVSGTVKTPQLDGNGAFAVYLSKKDYSDIEKLSNMEPDMLFVYLKKLFSFKNQNLVSVKKGKNSNGETVFKVMFSGNEAELEAGKFASFLYDEGLESGTVSGTVKKPQLDGNGAFAVYLSKKDYSVIEELSRTQATFALHNEVKNLQEKAVKKTETKTEKDQYIQKIDTKKETPISSVSVVRKINSYITDREKYGRHRFEFCGLRMSGLFGSYNKNDKLKAAEKLKTILSINPGKVTDLLLKEYGALGQGKLKALFDEAKKVSSEPSNSKQFFEI
ncbi:MAG: hypothetical protein A3F10_01385 [Coxiella sp. RIFCSPHIGHO2_12_FULL_42_15]|nr:MAG: hypothetical protein A3F10_01385 [Coxiella sp. RIFCSPHIGHO2_12_FULL_42_15]